MTRSREISVRLALGAARSRIVRQSLVERVLISSLGGFAGFWLATWGVRAFALAATGAGLSDQIAGDWFDQILDYSMDYRVFAFVTAIAALLLASIGLYAVVATWVSQRTHEIGIRMAIGGNARDILRLVFSQGITTLVLGLSIGLAAALLMLPALKAVLIQVSPADPLTLAVTTTVLSAAASLGCLIPARRAIRIDPLRALRSE